MLPSPIWQTSTTLTRVTFNRFSFELLLPLPETQKWEKIGNETGIETLGISRLGPCNNLPHDHTKVWNAISQLHHSPFLESESVVPSSVSRKIIEGGNYFSRRFKRPSFLG